MDSPQRRGLHLRMGQAARSESRSHGATACVEAGGARRLVQRQEAGAASLRRLPGAPPPYQPTGSANGWQALVQLAPSKSEPGESNLMSRFPSRCVGPVRFWKSPLPAWHSAHQTPSWVAWKSCRPVAGGWLAVSVAIMRGGQVIQKEDYADWRGNVDLSPDFFVAEKWSAVPHWHRSTP